MSAFLSPIFGAGFQAFNNTGGVLAGGKLYTYQAGSTTPQATWTTSLQSVPNANPIVFDSAGRYANEVWLQGGSTYKFVLTDSSGNVLGTWDNIGGVNDASYAGFSEWVTYGVTPTYISTTSFSVAGNQTGIFQVGRRVQASVSGGSVYGSVYSSSFGSGITTVVLTMDSTNLDSSLFSVAYGFMSATNTSLPVSIYAPINSPTFTGTPTAPVPSQTNSTAQLATTSFVQTLVTNSITPSGGAGVWVSGTTYAVGNVVYSPLNFQTYRRKIAGAGATDPSLDTTNWKLTGSLGAGGTTITGNVTLGQSSSSAMTATPTTPGLYATLPDATTCTAGTPLFSIYNAGDYDYGIKDSTGTQLGWVRARTGAVIGLSDNSTAAGTWTLYGVEKTAITATYINTSLANFNTNFIRVTLDSNRTCLLYGGATTVYAIVYDASTQTWGSNTLVRSGIAGNAFAATLSATNQVLVCSCDTTTGMQTATLTISGTSITPNTPVSTTLAGNYASFGQLIAVGSSFVVSYGRATNTTAIRAISVSGTAPTVGAESALTPAVTTSASLFASGSVVRTVSASASFVYAKPFTVSGSTLSAGTEASTACTAAGFRAVLNGNGNIACHYTNTNHYAAIFKLTTTTEAVSPIQISSIAPGGITTYTDYAAISASKTIIYTTQVGNSYLYANIVIDSSGTASAGTELVIQTANVAAQGVCAGYTTSSVANVAFMGQVTAGDETMCAASINVSGASPTLNYSDMAVFRSYVNGFNPVCGQPMPSNIFGVRAPITLIAGTTSYSLGGTYVTSDFRFSSNSFGMPNSLKARIYPNGVSNIGASGANSNEGWVANLNSTGFIIQRVEAAA
jgi:hypothetical protein